MTIIMVIYEAKYELTQMDSYSVMANYFGYIEEFEQSSRQSYSFELSDFFNSSIAISALVL